jgi:hypothetical protein
VTAERDGDDAARQVDALVQELCRAFPNAPTERVHDVVLGTWQEFLGARVRDFVPLLVRRRAMRSLRAV